MKSMTGFGRGRCEIAGRRFVVELRSVNHRFLEVKTRLPWNDPVVEHAVGQAVRKHADRGSVSVVVRDEGGAQGSSAVAVDLELARSYAQVLTQIAVACGLDERPTLALIAAQPGVLSSEHAALEGEPLWEHLAPGVEAALVDLSAARLREGSALLVDLQRRVDFLRRVTVETTALTADAPAETRRRLEERLRRLLAPGEVDPQRLAQEVALIADRADITEELTRIVVHLDEVQRLLEDSKPAGRRLDFLAQELHREVNTVGSKSQNPQIAARVVEAKAEVERLREQVQNVE